jgi:DNA transposition AAA+ family ATPase
MNDPSTQPIDVEEQRLWLIEHKNSTGLAWKQLGGRLGVNPTSLSLWAGGNYNAPGSKFAEAVFRHRQMLASQASIKVDLPDIPNYFETETSQRLIYLLSWAQRGRMAAAAMSPGLGKTITAEHYKACNSNVFIITVQPATSSVLGMMSAVARAIGITHPFSRKHDVSHLIAKALGSMGNPLLIVDEAQHAKFETLDQLRSWHDAVGVGVALLGNAGLLQTLEGQSRSVSHAQLFSRISFKLSRLHPLAEDIEAMLEAWRITDPKVSEFVKAIAGKPGGLRGATFTLELAHMIAASTGEDLAVTHLQDAWTQLSTRPVAA